MGGCFSSDGSGDFVSSSSALVISPAGELRPYSTPVSVSDILQMEESSSSSSSSFFICNSDNLSYDEHITALDSQDELDAGQIYFVLPVSKLQHPLSASEMAALAVKASVALNSKPNNKNNNYGSSSKTTKHRSGNKSKVSPFIVMESSKINVIVDEKEQYKQQKVSSVRVSQSGSIRKLHRYSSRKARLAVRSFKLRLSTIYETESYSSDQSHKYYC